MFLNLRLLLRSFEAIQNLQKQHILDHFIKLLVYQRWYYQVCENFKFIV